MADDRLWMFNPGCVEEPCCGDDEPNPCEEVCVDVTGGNPGSEAPLSGATIDGGSLGTAITDGSGRACFDISESGPGLYTFTISKSGYVTNTVDIEVPGEDCVGGTAIKDGGNLYPDPLPADCIQLLVRQCGPCIRPGAPVTFTSPTPGFETWSYSGFTQSNGKIRVCPPAGAEVDVFIGGDGGPQADTPNPLLTITGIFSNEWTGSANINGFWFCFPGYPFHCMSPYPPTVTVTDELGNTYTCTLDPTSPSLARYESGRIFSGGQWIQTRIDIPRTSGGCGTMPAASGTVSTYDSDVDPAANSLFNYLLFPPAGTIACPINMKIDYHTGGVRFPGTYLLVVE